MSELPDSTINLFNAVVLTTNLTDTVSASIPVRVFAGNRINAAASRISLLGSLTLAGSATIGTFAVEESDDNTNWRPAGILNTPVVATGVGTGELCDLRFTRTVSGAMPAFSFRPDASFIRVKAKADNATTATLTLDAYLHQSVGL